MATLRVSLSTAEEHASDCTQCRLTWLTHNTKGTVVCERVNDRGETPCTRNWLTHNTKGTVACERVKD